MAESVLIVPVKLRPFFDLSCYWAKSTSALLVSPSRQLTNPFCPRQSSSLWSPNSVTFYNDEWGCLTTHTTFSSTTVVTPTVTNSSLDSVLLWVLSLILSAFCSSDPPLFHAKVLLVSTSWKHSLPGTEFEGLSPCPQQPVTLRRPTRIKPTHWQHIFNINCNSILTSTSPSWRLSSRSSYYKFVIISYLSHLSYIKCKGKGTVRTNIGHEAQERE